MAPLRVCRYIAVLILTFNLGTADDVSTDVMTVFPVPSTTTSYSSTPSGVASGLTCHNCGAHGDLRSGNDLNGRPASCLGLPFIANAAGVSLSTCPDGMSCMTVRVEYPDGKFTVMRRCSPEVHDDGCVYSSNVRISGDQMSECYCKTHKCNAAKTSVIDPLTTEPPSSNGSNGVAGTCIASVLVLLLAIALII